MKSEVGRRLVGGLGMKKLGEKSTSSLIILYIVHKLRYIEPIYDLHIEQREQVNVVSIPPLSAHAQSKLLHLFQLLYIYPSASEGSILHMHTPSEDEQEQHRD